MEPPRGRTRVQEESLPRLCYGRLEDGRLLLGPQKYIQIGKRDGRREAT